MSDSIKWDGSLQIGFVTLFIFGRLVLREIEDFSQKHLTVWLWYINEPSQLMKN